jgi:hypothetical protein
MNDGTPKFAKYGKPKNLSLNQLQILGVEGTHQENAGLRSKYAIELLGRRGRCSPNL